MLVLAAESGELAQPIVEGLDDILAEVVWAAREQQATTLGDALLRRTRIGLLAGRECVDLDSGLVERVATALASELAWDEDERARQIADFLVEAADEGVAVEALSA